MPAHSSHPAIRNAAESRPKVLFQGWSAMMERGNLLDTCLCVFLCTLVDPINLRRTPIGQRISLTSTFSAVVTLRCRKTQRSTAQGADDRPRHRCDISPGRRSLDIALIRSGKYTHCASWTGETCQRAASEVHLKSSSVL